MPKASSARINPRQLGVGTLGAHRQPREDSGSAQRTEAVGSRVAIRDGLDEIARTAAALVRPALHDSTTVIVVARSRPFDCIALSYATRSPDFSVAIPLRRSCDP